MSKTLGRLAEKAYREDFARQLSLGRTEIRYSEAWEAAAQAVVNEWAKTPSDGEVEAVFAVIEAARIAASISYPSHVEKYAAIQGLRAAVRALDKAEAGDEGE